MKEFLEVLKLMKHASSKDNYPLYAQYIKSTGGKLITCNNNSYIEMSYKAPFEGCVNIFVLIDTLSMLEGDVVVEDTYEVVTIKAGNFKTDLIKVDMEFPSVELEDVDTTLVDQDYIETLKYAAKFVGKENLAPLFIDKEGILATDGNKIFMNKIFNTKHKTSLTNKIVQFLRPGHEIGMDEKGNVVVSFVTGFGKFSTESLHLFPDSQIKEYMLSAKVGVKRLCNIAPLIDAATKLVPIFHNEQMTFMDLSNLDKMLKMEGTSMVNGRSTVDISSDIEEPFSIAVNVNFLKTIPYDFDVFVDVADPKYLFLKNDNGSQIVLMGAKK